MLPTPLTAPTTTQTPVAQKVVDKPVGSTDQASPPVENRQIESTPSSKKIPPTAQIAPPAPSPLKGSYGGGIQATSDKQPVNPIGVGAQNGPAPAGFGLNKGPGIASGGTPLSQIVGSTVSNPPKEPSPAKTIGTIPTLANPPKQTGTPFVVRSAPFAGAQSPAAKQTGNSGGTVTAQPSPQPTPPTAPQSSSPPSVVGPVAASQTQTSNSGVVVGLVTPAASTAPVSPVVASSPTVAAPAFAVPASSPVIQATPVVQPVVPPLGGSSLPITSAPQSPLTQPTASPDKATGVAVPVSVPTIATGIFGASPSQVNKSDPLVNSVTPTPVISSPATTQSIGAVVSNPFSPLAQSVPATPPASTPVSSVVASTAATPTVKGSGTIQAAASGSKSAAAAKLMSSLLLKAPGSVLESVLLGVSSFPGVAGD